MTRETRIGLLVGLMFIILFGLVLSELTGTGETGATAAPSGAVGPQAWTPTRTRVEPERSLSAAVDTPPPGESRGVVEVAFAPPARQGTVESRFPRQVPRDPDAASAESWQQTSSVRPPSPAAAGPEPATPRIYTVASGDSLIKIAKKVYGDGHGDDYMRIYEANRDKLSSPSVVVVGQELVIPPLSGPQDAAPVPQPRVAEDRRRTPTPPDGRVREMTLDQLRGEFGEDSNRPARRRMRVYVVRGGDNLTKIARKILNDDSESAVKRLYDANRDKLSSPNLLTPGMKLEIPES